MTEIMAPQKANSMTLSNDAGRVVASFLSTNEQAALASPSEARLREAEVALVAAEGISRPANGEERLVMVEMLAASYPESAKQASAGGDASVRAWWNGFKTGLEDVPADLIRLACRRWLRGKHAFMPKPGELRALIEPSLRARRAELERTRERVANMRAALSLVEA